MSIRKRFEELAEHLELLIFSGRLKAGDAIPSERELMQEFGVGRSTVREALFSLQRKGLLSGRAGAVARVSNPTPDTIVSELSGAARHMLSRPEGVRHLQHARALLEIGLAREAALHASEEDIAELGQALEANRTAPDQAAFEKSDLLFHYTLAMIAHNPVFTSLNHALNAWLAEQRTVSARAGADPTEVYLQHKAVYDAIARRDAVAAEQAMEKHLTTVAEYYWRAVSFPRTSRGTPQPSRDGGPRVRTI